MAIDLGNDPGGTPPTAGEKLQIRSAIGVGTTDAPTFLAQTLTGQSLTGTQATSLVDLSATWNTTGNPSLIYGRVTNTNSGTTANLIDLGTFAGGSMFSVTKTGITKADSIQLPGGGNAGSSTISGQNAAFIHIGIAGHIRFWGAGSADMASFKYDAPGLSLPLTGSINWTGSASTIAAATSVLTQDAAGILAQRNGVNAQALRVANSVGASPLVDYDRGVFDFKTTTNTLRIGTENGGTYTTARPIEFVTGGVVRMSLPATGGVTVIGEIITSTLANFAWLIRAPDTDTGIRFNGSRTLSISDTINVAAASVGAKLTIRSDAPLQWSSGTNMGSPSPDSGISRNAAGGMLEVNSGTAGVFRDLRVRSLIQQPPATITPASNGDLVVEATSNTLLTFKYKGSDGTVRSGTMVVA